MNAMTKSAWDTGTYELLVSNDPAGQKGDLMVVVFARPADPDDDVANEDAPVLAHIDVMNEEYDWNIQDYHLGLRSIGERGMLTPENVPGIYGDRLGLRILLALYQGAERDFNGTDMDDIPWRTPSSEAFVIMERTHAVMEVVKERLGI